MDPRPLEELLSDEDAWPLLKEWAAAGGNDAEFVDSDRADGEEVLLQLQVTTRSPLGALAFHAAVVYVDHRWVRVLGAGGTGVGASLADPVPGGATGQPEIETGLIIATDALGGFFVVNGGDGSLPGEAREVVYLAPDTLKWEPMELGNSDFLRWLFGADLGKFYEGTRWPGWEDEVRSLTPAEGIHTYPPLFTKEGADVAEASRRPVPIGELWSLWLDFRGQLGVAE